MPPFEPDIKRLSALPFAESLVLMLYGGSGSGKTYFIGTAGPRTLIINAGEGLTTLQSPAFREKYPYDPLIASIPEDIKDPLDYVCETIDYMVKNRRDEFDTIAIDDMSAVTRYARRKAIAINADLGKTTTEATMKKYGGVMSPQIADYGEEINVIEWFLAEYTPLAKKANFHLICTAHERHLMGKPARIGDPPPLRKILPGFTGQTFPDKIPAYFDEVWRMEVVGKGDRKKWRCHTMGSETQVGKTRHGGVFKEIEDNITFPFVVQEIKKHKYIPDPNNPELLIKAS